MLERDRSWLSLGQVLGALDIKTVFQALSFCVCKAGKRGGGWEHKRGVGEWFSVLSRTLPDSAVLMVLQ